MATENKFKPNSFTFFGLVHLNHMARGKVLQSFSRQHFIKPEKDPDCIGWQSVTTFNITKGLYLFDSTTF